MFPWDKQGSAGGRTAYRGNPNSQQGNEYRLAQNRARNDEIAKLQKYVGDSRKMKLQSESARRQAGGELMVSHAHQALVGDDVQGFSSCCAQYRSQPMSVPPLK